MCRASIVIPTKNRREQLLRTLTSVFRQSVPLEVFVVDDGSAEDSSQQIREAFPQVRYSYERVSRGPVFVRNRAIEQASTPFVFTIDDDCELPSEHSVAQTLSLFDDPRLAAVTIPFINVLKDRVVHSAATSNNTTCVGFDYWGGMVAFRREAYLAVGGYREELFMHVEEADLAVRLLNAGYLLRYGTADPIHHMESKVRASERLIVLGARNHVLYAWNNTPLMRLPLYLMGTTFLSLRSCMKNKRLISGFRGIGEAIAIAAKHPRRPVRSEAFRLARYLRRKGCVPLAEVEAKFPSFRR